MIHPFPRWAALAGATAVLAFTSSGAIAQASITLSDSNCSDFVLGGSPGARTLTCVVSSAPACTVTGPSTGTTGSPITLTASCAPAATSWVWTGGNCASSTSSTCQDTQTLIGNVNYTVKGTNSIGPGNTSPPFTVAWSNTPPAAPSNCSISGAPSGNQTAGVQVTLTMNCSGGGAASANGYVWTGSGAAGQTTQTVGPITVNTTRTFTATASNAGGTSAPPPASATVTIGGGGGGGGGPISCANQGFLNTKVLDMAWGSIVDAFTGDVGGFGATDALVVRFTTPNITSATGKGSIIAVEFGSGGTVPRAGALSATPCDFNVGMPLYACSGSTSAFSGDVGPKVNFSLVARKSCAATLQPSTTYYFNLSNFVPANPQTGLNACSLGLCDMKIELQKPSGS